MPSSKIERKLAAIMFTDIAGYTESMSKSESKSLDTLEKKRSILKPLLKEYKGTFVKEIGDGTLSYFESAVNAATCAVKLQETENVRDSWIQLNHLLYQLLEDKFYLETAYSQVQEKASVMENELAKKFLS